MLIGHMVVFDLFAAEAHEDNVKKVYPTIYGWDCKCQESMSMYNK